MLNRKNIPFNRGGFSLLEVAISLVLIALLVGGTLTGRNLLRAAELRSIMEGVERYRSATENFREKYDGLPGDLTDAVALWGAAHANPATCKVTIGTGTQTCNGDGDGRIKADSPLSNEIFRYWQQLANAGFIVGKYTGVAGDFNGNFVNDMEATPGVNVPAGKMDGTGFTVLYATQTWIDDPGWFDGDYIGNMFLFGRSDAGEGDSQGGVTDEPVITPAEMLSIDAKFDDGRPGTGRVMTYNSNWISNCVTSDDPLTARYNTSIDEPTCMLLFPRIF